MKKQSLVLLSVLAVFGLLLVVACGPTPTPVVVKETVPVPQTVAVRETVAVPQTVVVKQTVVAEKVVTATPVPAPATKKLLIGWSPVSDPVDEARLNVDKQFRQGITEAGGVMMYCSPSPRGGAVGDPATQAACVDTFIAAGVSAIASQLVDVQAMIPSIQKANKAGIPVFLWSTTLNEDTGVKVILSQAPSNRASAIGTANRLVDLLTKKFGSPKGVVLEVTGNMLTGDGIERSGFWHEVMDKYPGIKITSKDAGWDMAKSGTIIQDWMLAHPETDAIAMESSAYLAPAISILDKTGRWKKVGEEGHVIITIVGASNVPLYALKRGYVDMLYDQGHQFAALPLVRAMMKYLNTGVLPVAGDKIETGVTGFEVAAVEKVTGKAGLVFMVLGLEVTKANVNLPGLFGNFLMGPPNGISPEGGTDLWKGD